MVIPKATRYIAEQNAEPEAQYLEAVKEVCERHDITLYDYLLSENNRMLEEIRNALEQIAQN